MSTPWGRRVRVCAHVCVCVTKSYITKHFNTGAFVQNIQHLVPPLPAPMGLQRKLRTCRAETIADTSGCGISRTAALQVSGPRCALQTSAAHAGTDATDAAFGTHQSLHNKLGFVPLQHRPPLKEQGLLIRVGR